MSKMSFLSTPHGLQTKKPKSWLCMDLYAFATPYRLTGDWFFFQRHHSFKLPWLEPAEEKYVSAACLCYRVM